MRNALEGDGPNVLTRWIPEEESRMKVLGLLTYLRNVQRLSKAVALTDTEIASLIRSTKSYDSICSVNLK